jgi:hypothetical protein
MIEDAGVAIGSPPSGGASREGGTASSAESWVVTSGKKPTVPLRFTRASIVTDSGPPSTLSRSTSRVMGLPAVARISFRPAAKLGNSTEPMRANTSPFRSPCSGSPQSDTRMTGTSPRRCSRYTGLPSTPATSAPSSWALGSATISMIAPARSTDSTTGAPPEPSNTASSAEYRDTASPLAATIRSPGSSPPSPSRSRSDLTFAWSDGSSESTMRVENGGDTPISSRFVSSLFSGVARNAIGSATPGRSTTISIGRPASAIATRSATESKRRTNRPSTVRTRSPERRPGVIESISLPDASTATARAAGESSRTAPTVGGSTSSPAMKTTTKRTPARTTFITTPAEITTIRFQTGALWYESDSSLTAPGSVSSCPSIWT